MDFSPEAAITQHREVVEERREGPFWLESVTGVGKAEEHRMGFVTAGWGQAPIHSRRSGVGRSERTTAPRSFGHFRCDGSSFLPYDPKTHGWPVPWSSPQTLAKEIMMQMAFKPGFLSLCAGRALCQPAEISRILDGLLGRTGLTLVRGLPLPQAH